MGRCSRAAACLALLALSLVQCQAARAPMLRSAGGRALLDASGGFKATGLAWGKNLAFNTGGPMAQQENQGAAIESYVDNAAASAPGARVDAAAASGDGRRRLLGAADAFHASDMSFHGAPSSTGGFAAQEASAHARIASFVDDDTAKLDAAMDAREGAHGDRRRLLGDAFHAGSGAAAFWGAGGLAAQEAAAHDSISSFVEGDTDQVNARLDVRVGGGRRRLLAAARVLS